MNSSNMKNIYVMVVALVFCFVILTMCYFNSLVRYESHVSRAKPSLRMVIVVSRHGQRAPLHTFPKDPFPPNNTAFWPFGESQLTLRGRLQMYNLGIRIRTLYDGFLDEFYDKDNFKAFSTETDRTMMSAQLFLAGLFAPRGFQVWNDKLKWQPIPVYRNEWDKSEYIESICPRYKDQLHLNFEKNNLHENHTNAIFLQNIQSYTGIDINDDNNIPPAGYILKLSDSIISAYNEGLPLPAWAQDIYPQLEIKITQIFLKTFFQFNILCYTSGLFFRKIKELMEEAISNDTGSPKMYFFSGHDKTIVGLNEIVGIAVTSVINPGSTLIFELHEDMMSRQNFFELVYIDGTTLDLESRNHKIAGCQLTCDFNIMENLSNKCSNFTDLTEECQQVQYF